MRHAEPGTPTRRGVIGGLAVAAATASLPAQAKPFTYDIPAQIIGDGLWMLRGADAPIERGNGGAIANITLIDTDVGAVLVDCGPSLRYATALKAVARTLTGKPVVRIFLTHLHPDHIYGSAGFDPAIVSATPALIAGLRSEGAGFVDGMYRLLGDWMRGTEFAMPGHVIDGPAETIGGRTLNLLALSGHSGADLAVHDPATGVLIAGDLVFHDRAPSTPHADLPRWRAALDRLKSVGHKSVVPGHGPFDATPFAAIDQTRDWLDWVDHSVSSAVAMGIDPAEAGGMPIPSRFARLKAARYELERSVAHLYPALDLQKLPRIDAGG